MRLPLYETPPRVAVETAEGLDVTRSCDRCNMREGVTTVCLGGDGEPGGLLVVGESPGRNEDLLARPFIGESGKLLRGIVAKHWRGPVAIDNAVKCAPGKREIKDKHVDACRGFLTKTVEEAKPTRIISLGGWSAVALTGRSFPMLTNRRSYTYLVGGRFSDKPIPLFFVMHPAAALRNRFVRSWFTEDLTWALTADPPRLPPLTEGVRLVTSEADALEAVAEFRGAEWTSFDVETFGVMREPTFRLLCVSFCARGSESAWTWDRAALDNPATLAPLVAYLRDPKARKIGANVKYDAATIGLTLGVRVEGVRGDVRLWRKLLEPEADAKLEKMVELVGMGGMKEEAQDEMERYLRRVRYGLRAEALLAKRAAHPDKSKKWPKLTKDNQDGLVCLRELEASDPELVRLAHDKNIDEQAWSYALLPRDVLVRYNARDVVGTTRLGMHLEEAFKSEPDLDWTRTRIVERAERAIQRVEEWGIFVDNGAILAFDAYLAMQLEPIRKRLDQYGADFDPDSPDQVAELLFEKLKLPALKETKGGKLSTDGETLEALAERHPVAKDISDWRTFSKLKGTYAGSKAGEGMFQHIRPDGRIHTSILLDGARSGRTSSSNPNLQNIPSEKRDPVNGKLARDIFVSPQGSFLIQLDYSQLELRIAAALSGDPEMRAIFEAGVDYHQRTAELVSQVAWGIHPSQVGKQHRAAAKTINFGVLYGMGDVALAKKIGAKVSEAAKTREAIMGKFKRLDAWIKECLRDSQKTGVAWTYWEGRRARRRPLWRIADQDDGARINAENSAHNTPVQGSASDYCIASLLEVVEWIEADGLGDVAKLILPVHDALLLEVRRDYAREVAGTVREIMRGWPANGVPLEVDVEIGTAWGSLTHFKELDG